MEIGSVRLLEKTGGKSDLPAQIGWRGAVIVMSDRASRGEYEDQSGPLLEEGLKSHGASEVDCQVLPDEPTSLLEAVSNAVQSGATLVFVSGGTGVGPRDITVATLRPLFERELPGVATAFQAYGQSRIPTAMLGNAVAGIIGGTVVVAIPGSPGAARDALACLMPSLLHAHAMLGGGGHE